MVDWRVCPACGYALRGLVEETPSVVCPECGHRWGTRDLRENDLLVAPMAWGRVAWLPAVGTVLAVASVLTSHTLLGLVVLVPNVIFAFIVLRHHARRRHGELIWVVSILGGLCFGVVLSLLEFLLPMMFVGMFEGR